MMAGTEKGVEMGVVVLDVAGGGLENEEGDSRLEEEVWEKDECSEGGLTLRVERKNCEVT